MKILIVISQFNKTIVSALEEDAVRSIKKYDNVSYDVLHVPGAFEIPCAISMAISSTRNYDGYLALGCVVRGSTSHYEIVSREVARNISKMTVKYKIPIGYGVINAENLEQGMARVGINARNNYAEGALDSVIQMIKIKTQLLQNG